jgi:hypothetical protein
MSTIEAALWGLLGSILVSALDLRQAIISNKKWPWVEPKDAYIYSIVALINATLGAILAAILAASGQISGAFGALFAGVVARDLVRRLASRVVLQPPERDVDAASAFLDDDDYVDSDVRRKDGRAT